RARHGQDARATGGTCRAELGGDDDGGVLLGADGVHGRLVHADDLVAVDDLDARVFGGTLGENLADVGLAPHEHEHVVGGELGQGIHASADDGVGGVVAAHGVDGDAHGGTLLLLLNPDAELGDADL